MKQHQGPRDVPAGGSGSGSGGAGKLKGAYTGTISGKASIPSIGSTPLPQTPGTLKLPAGKGKIKLSATGFPTLKGKVTKFKVRQGGRKVIQTGKTKISAAQTSGFGSITGDFRSVSKLKSGQATVRARANFSVLGGTAIGIFKGRK